MDHFNAIGFSSDKLKDYIVNALGSDHRIKSPNGEYKIAQESSGASIIVGVRKKNFFQKLNVVGANPHFKGVVKNKIFLHSLRIDQNHLEAEACAWMNPLQENLSDAHSDFLANGNFGKFPFTFNLAFADLFGSKVFPCLVDVTLTCFPHQFFSVIKSTNDLEKFWQKIGKKPIDLGEKAFLPESTFVDAPPNVSFLSGIVKDVQKLKNSDTGINFYYCKVEGYECEFEIVFSENQTAQQPEVLDRIIGRFWITGEISR